MYQPKYPSSEHWKSEMKKMEKEYPDDLEHPREFEDRRYYIKKWINFELDKEHKVACFLYFEP